MSHFRGWPKAAMIVDPSGTNQAVTGAIRQAARMTGTDFKYLLATAQVESNLNPTAKASTSSAHGLFQFIEQTWLGMLKERGPALGYAPYADAIARRPSGEYAVSDPRMRGAVMNLRSDPTANALMAGAYTRMNAGKLAERLGREPTGGELYIAHFLGSGGASQLIALAESTPQAPAAASLPEAARANPSIFFDRSDRARGAAEVYRHLVGRYEAARGGSASNSTQTAATAAGTPGPLVFTPALIDQLNAAAPRTVPATGTAESGSVFYGLFHTGPGREAVSPVVQALWSSPPVSPVAVPATPSGAAPGQADSLLDLFRDRPADTRSLFSGRSGA
jgi:hypothetical protein